MARKATTAKVTKAPAKTQKAIAKTEKVPKTTKKNTTKEPVAPKKNTTEKKCLDLCLILDCTASMGSWIERSKNTLKEIIQNVKESNKGLDVQAAFVGYRDINDTKRFEIKDFSGDLESVKDFIGKMQATGGADFPEDVQGGYNKALNNLAWRKNSIKTAFHIADAPGHGKDICDSWGDSYPGGSPDGFKIQDQMREFAKRDITFTFVKVNESCNRMIKVMEDNYKFAGRTMNLTDLASACQTKTAAEVTKDFVKATSFILSAAVGGTTKSGKGKGKTKVIKKVKRTTEPLWDTKKFETEQFFSQTAYLKVTEIKPDAITVENSYGNNLWVSQDILENMYSADHFEKEVAVSMTALAEILKEVQDHVFSVSFRKQPNLDDAIELLQNATAKDLKNATMAKELVAGDNCTMTCHMIEIENNLGRSTVIDLNATSPSKFRQIDHRTIDWIIYQNVKYVLKKGGLKEVDLAEEYKRTKDLPKWDSSKLAVGNWFSGTSYYKAIKDNGDLIDCESQGKNIEISRDILEYEMHNAVVYASEENLPITQVATKMAEANSTCFTVSFTCKVNEKDVKERLSTLKPADVKTAAKAKEIAKELLTGTEQTLTVRLSRAEGKFGRSLVRDLPTDGYRQVDHRTIKSLIIGNVKYNVTRR